MSFDQLPSNRNFLNPTNFFLAINRLPGTVMNCQKVIMPTLSLPDIKIANPFNFLNIASASADFGELTVVFKIDEDFKNYMELFNWMTGLAFPENFQQYADLKHDETGNGGLRSDASLLILTSEKNFNFEVIFRDVFPIELSGFIMDSTDREANAVTARCTFSIRDFAILRKDQPVTVLVPPS